MANFWAYSAIFCIWSVGSTGFSLVDFYQARAVLAVDHGGGNTEGNSGRHHGTAAVGDQWERHTSDWSDPDVHPNIDKSLEGEVTDSAGENQTTLT